MDIRTGKTYSTKQDALNDGVPESDIAFVISSKNLPKVKFASGPFKNRTYKRNPQTGQLHRVND